jgi:hypothetical protein
MWTYCYYCHSSSTLPGQEYGTGSAAALASQVKKFFPNLWFGLLVGVTGLPNLSRDPPLDIRLGDMLVGLSTSESAGLIAYELGKEGDDDLKFPTVKLWICVGKHGSNCQIDNW